jgi:tetratricopeptide (TPR) repeat protein
MKKTLFVWLLGLVLVFIGLCVQGEEDPFDISATLEQIAEYGVPTVSSVATLEDKALGLFNEGKYRPAMEALEAFSKHANWLSNLISSGLDPFYGASYDDRKGFSYAKLQPLIQYESMGNEYKTKRNHAMVMQAECAVILGDKTKAVALFIKALDLIDIEDWTWWERTRKGLYALIGVP